MRGSEPAAAVGAHRSQVRARNDVAGHSRVRRTGSIGLRLLLPVAAASVGLIVGGTLMVAASNTAAKQAQRAKVLADATTAVVRLVDHIEQEVAETNALRERGGNAGAQLLAAERTRTDRALAEYVRASEAAVVEAPDIRFAAGHVTRLMDPFAKARVAALEPGAGVTGFDDAFEQITLHLLDLAAAIAEQVTDQELGNLARSAAGVSELKHLAAEQRDLLRAAFVERELPQGQLLILAQVYGDEQARISEVRHIMTEANRRKFTQLYGGPDVEGANKLRDAVLSSGGSAESLAVDADAWYIAQSGAMRQLRGLELELVERLAAGAQRNEANAESRALITAAIAGVVVLATLGGGAYLAVRTARRLRRLRGAALTVARGELPTAVAQVAAAGDSDAVRDAMGASHRRVGGMMDAGRDEVAEVSSALGVVHQQALRLAAEQALLRMEVSALFVALSRRGQTLVHRQLQLIDEFERAETDPDTLSRVFALDHLAARMRRNEENLLVLAGGEPGRRFDAPVALTDVVRSAAAEIEDYARVDALAADDLWIAAHAVGDVIHLLAELLDNATAFSPPGSRVRVHVQHEVGAVVLSVVDNGIGMSDAQLAESNRRLARPSGLTATLVGTMGLLVVARLAARRGVQVQLRRGAGGGGVVAEIRLPRDILVPAPARVLTAGSRAAPPPLPLPLPASVTAAVVPSPPAAPTVPLPAAPTVPAPVSPSPSVVGVPAGVAATANRTATGLPVRRPGTHGVTTTSDTPAGDRFLDPETVRARLSSLAGGIAAARRREAIPGDGGQPAGRGTGPSDRSHQE